MSMHKLLFVFSFALLLSGVAGVSSAPAQDLTPAQTSNVAPAPTPVAAVKKGKAVYTGPTEVVELAPTPMLDGEGKQRLDPDGKLMFNPPVRQQRDKSGHPLFDDKGLPIFQTATELGFDERGHKLHEKKEKQPKMVSVSISRGVLTVDGMVGKAALNYDIADLKYLYLYAPWIGTVVVSNVNFPGATEQANAFQNDTLTVKVEDHTFQLVSDKQILGKKALPAYIMVDRTFKLPSRVPVMGYGASLKAPYTWPGAKENPQTTAFLQPPPVPVSLRPVLLLPPCPVGQMRVAHAILPGEKAPPQPCVPINAVNIAATPAAPATGDLSSVESADLGGVDDRR